MINSCDILGNMDDNSWWHNLDIWRDWHTEDTVSRPVENAALDSIYHLVLHLTPKQHRQLTDWLETDGANFVASVFREMRHEASLRDVMAERGTTLAWVNVGTAKRPDMLCVEVELSHS